MYTTTQRDRLPSTYLFRGAGRGGARADSVLSRREIIPAQKALLDIQISVRIKISTASILFLLCYRRCRGGASGVWLREVCIRVDFVHREQAAKASAFLHPSPPSCPTGEYTPELPQTTQNRRKLTWCRAEKKNFPLDLQSN